MEGNGRSCAPKKSLRVLCHIPQPTPMGRRAALFHAAMFCGAFDQKASYVKKGLCAVIEFHNVSKTYENGTMALKDVSLQIQKGEFVFIVGASGAGKSTFLKLIMHEETPTSGTIRVGKFDLAAMKKKEIPLLRRTMGVVFQDFRLIPKMTVYDNVAFAMRVIGARPAEIRQRVDDALAAVGMGEFARHAPHLLSGGQKQRIAIAGVLAMEPECIVLDEATAMLDPVGRREVLSAVHRLNREKGITVVLITHHMNEAEDADRVVVMDDGKVIMDGAPRQVFTQVERLRSMGLTVPDTVDLLDRLRKDGLDVPLTALTVEECADAILAAVSK